MSLAGVSTGEFCPLTFGFYGLPNSRKRYHARMRLVCIGFAHDHLSKKQVFVAAELQAGPSFSLFENGSTDHTFDVGFFVRRQQALEQSDVSAWLFGLTTYWSGTSDPVLDFGSPQSAD